MNLRGTEIESGKEIAVIDHHDPTAVKEIETVVEDLLNDHPLEEIATVVIVAVNAIVNEEDREIVIVVTGIAIVNPGVRRKIDTVIAKIVVRAAKIAIKTERRIAIRNAVKTKTANVVDIVQEIEKAVVIAKTDIGTATEIVNHVVIVTVRVVVRSNHRTKSVRVVMKEKQ